MKAMKMMLLVAGLLISAMSAKAQNVQNTLTLGAVSPAPSINLNNSGPYWGQIGNNGLNSFFFGFSSTSPYSPTAPLNAQNQSVTNGYSIASFVVSQATSSTADPAGTVLVNASTVPASGASLVVESTSSVSNAGVLVVQDVGGAQQLIAVFEDGAIQLKSLTAAQLGAKTPNHVGDMFLCSNCAQFNGGTSAVVTASATTLGSWVVMGSSLTPNAGVR